MSDLALVLSKTLFSDESLTVEPNKHTLVFTLEKSVLIIKYNFIKDCNQKATRRFYLTGGIKNLLITYPGFADAVI